MIAFATVLLLASATHAQSQSDFVQSLSVPEIVNQTIVRGRYASTYELAFGMNPFYLRGDFNGDGRSDVAVLVTHRSNGKHGIAIVHAGTRAVHIVGAGTPIGNSSGDFRFVDYWYVYDKGPVDRGVGERRVLRLRGDAIHIGHAESASALIYWNGRRYAWYQQGD